MLVSGVNEWGEKAFVAPPGDFVSEVISFICSTILNQGAIKWGQGPCFAVGYFQANLEVILDIVSRLSLSYHWK